MCLNPCSDGMTTVLHNGQEKEQQIGVLILVLME